MVTEEGTIAGESRDLPWQSQGKSTRERAQLAKAISAHPRTRQRGNPLDSSAVFAADLFGAAPPADRTRRRPAETYRRSGTGSALFAPAQDCDAPLTICCITRMSRTSEYTTVHTRSRSARLGFRVERPAPSSPWSDQFPWGARERSEGSGAGPHPASESAVTGLTERTRSGVILKHPRGRHPLTYSDCCHLVTSCHLP